MRTRCLLFARRRGAERLGAGPSARAALVALLALGALACTHNVTRLQPSPSLGAKSLLELGAIERRDVRIALYIPPALLELEQPLRLAELHDVIVPVGEPLVGKLVQALSYSFDRLQFLHSPALPPGADGLMVVELLDHQIDLSTKPASLSRTRATLSMILRVKATLSDRSGATVWVGTAMVNRQGSTVYANREAGSSGAALGLNAALDAALDAAVAQIAAALRQSESLESFLREAKEGQP